MRPIAINAPVQRLSSGLPTREHRWMQLVDVGQPNSDQYPEVAILRELLGAPDAPVWRQVSAASIIEFAAIAMHPIRGYMLHMPNSAHTEILRALARDPHTATIQFNGGNPFTITAEINA